MRSKFAVAVAALFFLCTPGRAQCPGWSLLEIARDVQALEVYDDGGGSALYAGGGFTSAGGAPANFVARWDGANWSPLGGGVDNRVRVLQVHDDGSGSALYAGGFFTSAGGAPANFVAKWDGSAWSALGSGTSSIVECLEVFDDGNGPLLYAGWSGGVMKWDGTSWSSHVGANNYVYEMEVFDDGSGPSLFVGGAFTMLGGLMRRRVAKWDGTSWSGLGSGADDTVRGFEVWDDGGGAALFAGGNFSTISGTPANGVARWDGTSWSALGSGMIGEVNKLQAYDYGAGLHLYAGGQFLSAGGLSAHRIARWDGSAWAPLLSSFPGFEVYALEVFDDGAGEALFAGFTGGGVNPPDNLGRWGAAPITSYCTAGTSASGCKSKLSVTGTPSATASSGFVVSASRVEGGKNGRFFYGTDGRQANPWGNGSSYRCVVPPTRRTPVLAAGGPLGSCDGAAALDLNALWTNQPSKNPGPGMTVNVQFWYRDPLSTSNAPTSFSDALEFGVCP
jgi:hypothetical protein